MGRWVCIAACLGALAATPARAAGPVDPARACGAARGATVSVAVGARTALVHLPRVGRRPLALLLALHGAHGSGAFMERYTGLSRLADSAGFAVVYPDAAGPSWRISGADTDVRFLDALLDRLLAGGCFDARRISAVGVSNGGGMAARFACAGDDRLAGLVSVAGGYSTLPACVARRPLSVLEIHGTADTVTPYAPPPGQARGVVMRWIGGWVYRDGCPRRAQRARLSAHVVRLDWAPCRGGTAVAHLRLVGGAHAWPGAHPPDPGPSFGVSASAQAWRFLRARRLADHDEGG
jgi:polyhydroxybutyrate depolymerase